MSADKLPPDATLKNLTGPRTKREEFVRGVVDNFYKSKVDRGHTLLRIGVQGSGGRPNYRLEFPTLIESSGFQLSLHETLIYNGANHQTMTAFEADRAQEGTWSAETMTFSETEALLGELRKIRTP